ncbi:hypothetical protein ABZ805_17580 [Saccharopolyspora sp. NPDC047091]|uniref:hypothetical protein n=1 Tax=Saccharopolyspora sp. NPDC047091 TaxID=3155924 RepID=UPI0033F926E8
MVEQAHAVERRLLELVAAMEKPSVVTAEDCTRLAASLRGFAKRLDRFGGLCPTSPPSCATTRTRVFPGQQR